MIEQIQTVGELLIKSYTRFKQITFLLIDIQPINFLLAG